MAFFLDGYREVNAIVKISSNTITVDKQLQSKSQLKLTGQIIDDYGIPLPKAAIWLQSRSAEIERRTTSDDDGYFLVEDLKSGSDYQFTVSYSGHEKFSLNKQSITESSQPMRIELKALDKGTVAGTIVNATGYPVSNYAMKILNTNGSAGVQIITSDNLGQFEVASVYAGNLQINSMAEPRSTISGIKLAAGQDMNLTLVVDHGDYDVFGKVIDEGGHVIADAKIQLSWTHLSNGLRSSSNRSLQPDIQGDYRFQNIGPGIHLLMVTAEGFKPVRVNINAEQHSGSQIITMSR